LLRFDCDNLTAILKESQVKEDEPIRAVSASDCMVFTGESETGSNARSFNSW
jgi:hypothetical protein